jgi:hypothetical protein
VSRRRLILPMHVLCAFTRVVRPPLDVELTGASPRPAGKAVGSPPPRLGSLVDDNPASRRVPPVPATPPPPGAADAAAAVGIVRGRCE